MIWTRSPARLPRGGCGWLFARVGVTRSLGRPRWDRTGCLRSASAGAMRATFAAHGDGRDLPVPMALQSHGPTAVVVVFPHVPAQHGRARWISRLRRETSPRLLIPRGPSSPPVECWRGRGGRTPSGGTAAIRPLGGAVGPGAEHTAVPETCAELWCRQTVSNWRPMGQGHARFHKKHGDAGGKCDLYCKPSKKTGLTAQSCEFWLDK